jgi:hypothetical protein
MAIKLELTPEIEERLMAQAVEKGMTVESFLKATIENLLSTEPQLYQVGTALVIESTPIGNLENAVEQMRGERIGSLIADYECSV